MGRYVWNFPLESSLALLHIGRASHVMMACRYPLGIADYFRFAMQDFVKSNMRARTVF